jgi:hypothetical protein
VHIGHKYDWEHDKVYLVVFKNEDDASKCIRYLDGRELLDKQLDVNSCSKWIEPHYMEYEVS